MKGSGPVLGTAVASLLALLIAGTAAAQTLTVEEAVRLALANSSQAIGAEADVLDARGSLYGAYSRVMPQFSASYSRSVSRVKDSYSDGLAFGYPVRTGTIDLSNYTNTPGLSGSWSVIDLSAILGVRSALSGMRAARYQRTSARNDVVLAARSQFYKVVQQVRLAGVATDALKLSRDDERRVQALYEVGSVSKSDLLKAQVATAQSELDSLTAAQAVIVERIALASLLGVREAQMAPVDTSLTVTLRTYDEAGLVEEAARNRPDLQAAEAELRAAKSGRTSARLARMPYLTVSGSAGFNTKSSGWRHNLEVVDFEGDPTTGNVIPIIGETVASTEQDVKRTLSGSIALNWNIFDGFAADSRNAAARARVLRAQNARDVMRRNLESDVHEALVAYDAAVKRRVVAQRAIDSATENLKLTQQKYNVGSATILDLVDAQVQMQRAQSDGVSALVAIRVAEAQVDRVRGSGE